MNSLNLKLHLLKPFWDMFISTFSIKQIKNKYGEQYYEEANKSIVKMNLNRMVPLSTIILIYQIIIFILDNNTGFYSQVGNIKYVNMLAGAFLFITCLVCTCFAVYMMYTKKYSDASMRWLFRIFYFCMAIGLLAYIYSDVYRNGPPNTIYYLAIIFSIFPIFSLSETIFFVIFNTTGMISILLGVNYNNFLNNMHVLLLLLASWILLFYLRANTYNILFYQLSLKDVNERLDKLSKIDPLTNLPNRRYLDEFVRSKADVWKKKAAKVMVLMIDIDNFKNYNDTFSHLDGDDCLNAVTSAISKTLAATEGLEYLVSRIGGEEFIVLIEGWKTDEEIYAICEKLRKSVEDMHMISGNGSLYRYVTISIGGSIYDSVDTRSVDDVIESHYRFADYELYYAKKNGKNCVSIGNMYKETIQE